jgi:hypothetical protein
MVSILTKSGGSLADVVNGDGDAQDAKALIYAGSFAVGLPAKLINDVVQGTDAVMNDDAPWYSVLTGRPK